MRPAFPAMWKRFGRSAGWLLPVAVLLLAGKARADDTPATPSSPRHASQPVAVEGGAAVAEAPEPGQRRPPSQPASPPTRPQGPRRADDGSFRPTVDPRRPVGRLELRGELGLGGGTTGADGRFSLACDWRFAPDWGLSLETSADVSGGAVRYTREAGNLDLRLFWEIALPVGWFRLSPGLGPGVFGETAYICSSLPCVTQSELPAGPQFAFVGDMEVGYWLSRGVGGTVGFFLRGQLDTSGVLQITMNVGIGEDAELAFVRH